MQPKKITGIIIKIQPYLELDRILTIFSRECGRIRVFAKGVKKITSRRGGCLDLFNHVQMELEETGAGLNRRKYLREISNLNNFAALKLNPAQFGAACVIAYFLDKVLPEHLPQQALYALTLKTLSSLAANNSTDVRPKLLAYFLKTMRLLGFLPPVLPKQKLKTALWKTIFQLDPQFALNARRTLGIFDKLDKTRSS